MPKQLPSDPKWIPIDRRRFLGLAGSSAMALGLGMFAASCGSDSDGDGSAAETAGGTPSLEEGPLVVYNWGEYGPVQENIDGFLQEAGAQIRVENFSNNEEMLTQLRAGASGWDVVVPQDYQVSTMIQENLLLQLDHGSIPNFDNADPLFLEPDYDPGNEYTAPKTWGGTGFLWRSDILGEGYESWDDFVKLSTDNSGKTVVMDSPVDVIGSALRATGHSLNTTDLAAYDDVEAWLLDLKPHVVAIVPPGEITPLVVSGEGTIALSPANDAFQARTEHDVPVGWAYPAEGALQFLDNWAVPVEAPHPNLAHAFINYMLTPKAAAAEMNNLAYNTVNAAALEAGLIDEAMVEFLTPSAAAAENFEFQEEIGAEIRRIRDQIWTKFISA